MSGEIAPTRQSAGDFETTVQFADREDVYSRNVETLISEDLDLARKRTGETSKGPDETPLPRRRRAKKSRQSS